MANPVITVHPTFYHITENKPMKMRVRAYDPDNDPITVEVVDITPNVGNFNTSYTLVDNGDDTWDFTWVPSGGISSVTPFQIRFRASNI